MPTTSVTSKQTRVLTVGDIHGCLAQLDALLNAVQLTSEDHLVLLGDLVDRGPDSAGVLRRVQSLAASHRVTVIMGNHEQMMLEARDSHAKFTDWLKNGGDATLKSFGGTRGSLRDIPAEDWEFLSGRLAPYFENETHIFVHANVYPDMPLADQPDYMLRWERCDGIVPHGSGKVIVCGHTPQQLGRVMNRGFAICLDTDACRGGPLSCLDANSGRVWQAMANGRVERSHISDFES